MPKHVWSLLKFRDLARPIGDRLWFPTSPIQPKVLIDSAGLMYPFRPDDTWHVNVIRAKAGNQNPPNTQLTLKLAHEMKPDRSMRVATRPYVMEEIVLLPSGFSEEAPSLSLPPVGLTIRSNVLSIWGREVAESAGAAPSIRQGPVFEARAGSMNHWRVTIPTKFAEQLQ
jgi:hypothetical protein